MLTRGNNELDEKTQAVKNMFQNSYDKEELKCRGNTKCTLTVRG